MYIRYPFIHVIDKGVVGCDISRKISNERFHVLPRLLDIMDRVSGLSGKSVQTCAVWAQDIFA